MSDADKFLVIIVFLMVLSLLWSGRYNSPKNRERRARIDYLMREGGKERRDGTDCP